MDGERERIAELFGAHSAALRQYAVRRAGPEVDPDDIVAEVFAVAWRRLRDVPEGAEARPYLFAIARRVLANAERSARRRHRLRQAVHETRPPAEPEDGPGELVRAAVRQLKDRDREALVLVMWDGLSHAEAARVLGCSAGALATRLTRARARLRELLAELPGFPAPASDVRSQP